MAKYNEILVGRFNRFLQKLTGIKGGPVSPQLAGEVTPAIQLFNGVENRYLEGWDLFSLGFIQNNVAAQTTSLQIRNPGGTNVIAVIEKMSFAFTGVGDVLVMQQANTPQADLATPISAAGAALDIRGRSSPTLIITGGNNVALIGAPIERHVALVTVDVPLITTHDQEYPLMPGSTMRFTTVAVNNSLTMTIRWRERFMEEGERF